METQRIFKKRLTILEINKLNISITIVNYTTLGVQQSSIEVEMYEKIDNLVQLRIKFSLQW